MKANICWSPIKNPIFVTGFLLCNAFGSSAMAINYYNEIRKPFFLYAASVPAGIAKYYDALDEAWAISKTQAELSGSKPPYSTKVSNNRPCSDTTYIWGTPLYYCHDVEVSINGVLSSTRVEHGVSLSYGCPGGYNIVYPAAVAGATNSEPYCQSTAAMPDVANNPKSCKVGNSLDPQKKSKSQRDVDYKDVNGFLEFSRTYDSNVGGFANNLTFDFLPPKKGIVGSSDPMQMAQIWDWDGSAYNYINRYVYSPRIRIDALGASLTNKQGVRSTFTWDGSTATPVETYNKDTLQATTLSSGDAGWTLKSNDEQQLMQFNSDGQLQSMASPTGQSVALSYSSAAIAGVAPDAGYLVSATNEFGRALQFRYDDNGLLSQLVDPTGQTITYAHQVSNVGEAKANPLSRVALPQSVTYQDGSVLQYVWDEPANVSGTVVVHATSTTLTTYPRNRLTGIIDENSARYATFGYTGLYATRSEYAGGVGKYSVLDSRSYYVGTISVTDPLGTKMDSQYGLVGGGYYKITGRNQPAGSGCAASSSAVTYDTNGNQASADDFNGNRTCYSNDLTRNLAVVQVEGLAKTVTCSSVTTVAASLPAGSRKTSTQWHPDWQRATRVAEPLKLTTWVYNGQPDPTAGNVVASCAPASALLPGGKPIAVLCKKVEQATTDTNGGLGFSATTTGTARTWNYTYNQYGQVLTEKDPRGNTTTYAYHMTTTADVTLGDLKSVTNAAGHVTQYLKYDKAGRLLSSKDPNGVATDIIYAPRGWVKTITVTPPAGAGEVQTTTFNYDNAGQLKEVLQPDASKISYAYDDAHRLTGITDNAGNTVTYVLDNMGNRKGETLKDSYGVLAKSISRVYDALSRLQTVTGAPQ